MQVIFFLPGPHNANFITTLLQIINSTFSGAHIHMHVVFTSPKNPLYDSIQYGNLYDDIMLNENSNI